MTTRCPDLFPGRSCEVHGAGEAGHVPVRGRVCRGPLWPVVGTLLWWSRLTIRTLETLKHGSVLNTTRFSCFGLGLLLTACSKIITLHIKNNAPFNKSQHKIECFVKAGCRKTYHNLWHCSSYYLPVFKKLKFRCVISTIPFIFWYKITMLLNITL